MHVLNEECDTSCQLTMSVLLSTPYSIQIYSWSYIFLKGNRDGMLMTHTNMAFKDILPGIMYPE